MRYLSKNQRLVFAIVMVGAQAILGYLALVDDRPIAVR
jgi:hypothetical protein